MDSESRGARRRSGIATGKARPCSGLQSTSTPTRGWRLSVVLAVALACTLTVGSASLRAAEAEPQPQTLTARTPEETPAGGSDRGLPEPAVAYPASRNPHASGQNVASEDALTAVFENTPASHDGSTRFYVDLRFSEEVLLSYRAFESGLLTTTGGSAGKARRLSPPSNIAWRFPVTPDGDGNVVVTLPGGRACDELTGPCTDGGGRLSRTASVTVPGPSTGASPEIMDGDAFTVSEGETAVGTLTATDEDTDAADLSWSLSDGADRVHFVITTAGVLSFAGAKDYEAPDDANTDGAYQVTVVVSDGANTDQAELTVTLANVNEAPVADAGADQDDVGQGATVTLSGHGSDPDAGDALSYAWTQTSGPTVTLTDADTATATFTASAGLSADVVYTFELEVTDAAGLSHTDAVTVTVKVANALTAVFENTPASHDGSTRFDVDLRFSEEVVLSYRAFESGLLTTTGGSAGKARRLSPPSNIAWRFPVTPDGDGNVVVTLPGGRACDELTGPCTDAGGRLSRTASVTVPGPAAGASPEIVSADAFTVSEGGTAVGTLTATDEDTDAADLSWSLGDGADRLHFVITTAGLLSFAAAKDYEAPDDANADGAYQVTVVVSDGANTDQAELAVTLANVNEAPAADAGADQDDVAQGATVTLSGSGSDPDAGDTLSYAWTQTSGPTVTLTDADTTTASFAAPTGLSADAVYTFELEVTDAAGLSHTDAVTVTVQGRGSPAVTIAPGSSPVQEGTQASFTLSLDDAATGTLAVLVTVTESGAMLSGTVPTTVSFGAGDQTSTLRLATVDDAVIESDSTVTVVLEPGDGYTLGEAAAASVTVTDDDEPAWNVSAEPLEIGEGDSATLTVAITNGKTFALEQSIALAVSGTAVAADYRLASSPLQLAAGSTSATATVTAVDDQDEESAETVTIAASHDGSTIGAVTVTIAARDQPASDDATLSSLTLTGIDIGTFASATTTYTASVDNGVASTTVRATPAHEGASVTIADIDGSTRGSERTARLAVGATTVTVTLTAEDGETERSYSVTVTRAPAGDVTTLTDDLTAADVLSFVSANDIESVADLIQSLPPLYKRRFTLVFESEALNAELVSRTHPRVVSVGAEARFILSWASNPAAPDNVEFLEQGAEQWDAGVIDFSGDEPVLSRPAVCSTCHGSLKRPIWGGYPNWVGTDGTVDSAERAELAPFVSAARRSTNPRLSALEWRARFKARSTETGNEAQFSGFGIGDEVSSLLSVRHAEVLFNRFKKQPGYTAVAERVICQEGRHLIEQFPEEDRLIQTKLVGNELEHVQQSSGVPASTYVSSNARLADALRLLFLHDVWTRDTKVSDLYASVANENVSPRYFSYLNYRPGTATAEHELTASYDHFKQKGQGHLNARIDRQWRCTDPLADLAGRRRCDIGKDAVFGEGHFKSMAPRVCKILRQGDGEQLVEVRIADGEAGEDAGEIAFTVTIDPVPTESVTMDWTTARVDRVPRGDREKATRNVDYVRSKGTLSFGAGVASGQVTVAIVDDDQTERPEVFSVVLHRASSNALLVDAHALGTISGEIAVPQIASPTSFGVFEGERTVATLAATDADTPAAELSWSIGSGSYGQVRDASKFTLTGGGVLSFKAAKDFENPDDLARSRAYSLFVTVSDGTNDTTGLLTVFLLDVNEAPVADAGADQDDVAQGATVTLAGRGRDPDAGDTLSYSWTQKSGPAVTLADADAATATFTAPTGLSADAVYVFEFVVTDAAGLSHMDAVLVTVKGPPDPVVTVAADRSPVQEGSAATFTASLDKAAIGALSVVVTVTETGAMLSGTTPTTFAFVDGDRTGTLTLATVDDAVIESDSLVTVTLLAGDGYALGETVSATVSVEDDDVAEYALTVTPAELAEGQTATVRAELSNGVTYAEAVSLELSVTGEVTAADYALDSALPELAAGESAVSTTLTALADELDEAPEAARIALSLDGAEVAATALSIREASADAALSVLQLSDVDLGGFDPETTSYAATVTAEVSTTTVTAEPADANAAVEIVDASGSTLGTERTSTLATGDNEIAATVTAEDGVTERRYAVTVTREAGSAWGARLPERDVSLAGVNEPTGVWSDGATLWVSNWEGIQAYVLADGTRLPERDVSGQADLSSLWSDGATLWQSDQAGAVRAYRLSDGARTPAADLSSELLLETGNAAPSGLWSDAAGLRVLDLSDGVVYGYGADGARAPDLDLNLRQDFSGFSWGLWSDGATVLVTWYGDGRLRGYRLSDGTPLPERDIDLGTHGNDDPRDLWSDGETLWVVDGTDGKLYAYAVPGLERAVSSGLPPAVSERN